MESLVLFGVITYQNNEHKFSFKDNELTLYDRIEIDYVDNYSFPKFIIPTLYGKTYTGLSVSFLDCYLFRYGKEQNYSPSIIILSNQIELNDETKFNGLRLSGGSMNNFGDIINEIYTSKTGPKNFNLIRKGVTKFESRPYEDTDYSFTDDENTTEHYYSFKSSRQNHLNNSTLSKLNRSFFYNSVEGFHVKNVLNQVSDMLSFIKLISWKKNVNIEKITLGITGKDELNYPMAQIYISQPKEPAKEYNISVLDYKNDNNAIGKLYMLNKNLFKSHLFLLSEKHTYRTFDSKDILNSIITYEQIIDYFNIPKCKMSRDVKELRRKIITEYSDYEHFESLKNHLNNFRGINLKETLKKILDEDQILVSNLIEKFQPVESYDNLLNLLNSVIDFRNDVVHSSKFNIETKGLGNGAFIMTYINYYIVLIQASYTQTESIKILNKLFEFF